MKLEILIPEKLQLISDFFHIHMSCTTVRCKKKLGTLNKGQLRKRKEVGDRENG